MADYIIRTPKNPEYSGKTCGVLFQHGEAYVNEHTIEPGLGRSVEEVVRLLQSEFGYQVEEVKPKAVSAKKRSKAGARKAPEAEDGSET